MKHKLTLRRREPDGGMTEAIYRLERVGGNASENTADVFLLAYLEMQANAGQVGETPSIRVWIEAIG